ncbi:MAG: hypothetical protein IPK85_03035 [Gemmatimonadetes bacterium]|nr:hypothetical protein [Gemmatimonadota bacterium]
MTNTKDFASITSTSAFLDALEAHTAFAPFQTSSSEEGFEFNLLVTPREFWIVMGVLQPHIEDRLADLKIEYDAQTTREYGLVSVETRDRVGIIPVGLALLGAYDRINERG